MLVPIASPASHLFAHFALPGSDLSPKPQETQFVDLESTVNVFLGQSRHNGCPGTFWYLPGMHGRQNDVPLSLWYCPTPQITQLPSRAPFQPKGHSKQGSLLLSSLLRHPLGHASQNQAASPLNGRPVKAQSSQTK
jgi:hypothetical protein